MNRSYDSLHGDVVNATTDEQDARLVLRRRHFLEEVVAEPPQKDVFVDATVIATREESIGELLARC